MKAALLFKPRDIQVKEVEIVQPGDKELLVEITMAGICGSDFHRYTGDRPVPYYPLILGHEFTGVVKDIGAGVEKFKCGDRVIAKPYLSCGKCWLCISGTPQLCKNRTTIGQARPGCFAEYITIPENSAILVPDHISDQQAVLVEPLAVALRIIRKAGSLIGKKVAILGAGSIGLLVMVLAKKSGANVLLSDLFEEKLKLASELGGDITVNVTHKNLYEEIQNWTSEIGADIAIETAGVPKTVEQAISLVRPRGKVILAGIPTALANIRTVDIPQKEIKIEGSLYYVGEFEEALNIFSDNALSLDRLITHIFDLSCATEAFQVIEQKKAIKVLLRMKNEK